MNNLIVPIKNTLKTVTTNAFETATTTGILKTVMPTPNIRIGVFLEFPKNVPLKNMGEELFIALRSGFSPHDTATAAKCCVSSVYKHTKSFRKSF